MEIHYGKHHNGYTNNLNNAISGTELESKTIEEILKNLDLDNMALRNNAGGYFNHNLFWEIMGPNCGGNPSGEISEAINSNFNSFENFKEEFKKAAATRFGSGWAWLCVLGDGKLEICSTPNQDNPLMENSWVVILFFALTFGNTHIILITKIEDLIILKPFSV